MNWRDYERSIFRAVASRFPDSQIRADRHLDGRFSGVPRQIDVLAEASLMGFTVAAVVDCKCYARSVDVKDVEAVIGLAADVGAAVGLIVTTRGYSAAARARAANEPNVETHLSIVTVDDLVLGGAAYPVYALMHRGQAAVGVVAPTGWFVTSNRTPEGRAVYDLPALAVYHAPEASYDEARMRRAFGWSQISWSPDNPSAQEELITHQHETTLRRRPEASIRYWKEEVGNGAVGRTVWSFREIVYPDDDYIDLTCFLTVAPGYVFYTVLLTTSAEAERDANRLRQVAANCVPLYSPGVDPNDSSGHWASVLGASENPFPPFGA